MKGEIIFKVYLIIKNILALQRPMGVVESVSHEYCGIHIDESKHNLDVVFSYCELLSISTVDITL